MTDSMYRIRFYTEIGLLSEKSRKKAVKLPEQELHDFDKSCLPKTTYYCDGGNWIWFETRLAFIPSLGMKYYPDVSDFGWSEEEPIIKEVVYHEENNIFVVELDWGVFNPFEILRDLHGE
jgi:hypothetical protein